MLKMAQESMPDAHNVASPAQFDDLFDYDVDLDGILQDASARSNTNPPQAAPGPDAPGLGLGLDDEVKVTKTRKPVAKLDENRLLSQTGVPKLRRTSRQKLKFKGKGHEFSDAARLLNFYQLWLDDLFPRAKFTDGLAIIEKLGHSKRMQTMRRQWINEEMPKQQIGSDQQDQETKADRHAEPSHSSNTFSDITHIHSGQQPQLSLSPRPSDSDNGDLFVPDNNNMQPAVNENGPEYDDLEALLQEQENDTRPQTGLFSISQDKQSIDGDLFADELEVMEELDIPN